MLDEHLALVKNQIEFLDYRLSKNLTEGSRAKQEKIRESFKLLFNDLETLDASLTQSNCDSISEFVALVSAPSSIATSNNPSISQNENAKTSVSGDLMPEDLDGLPEEVLQKLGLRPSDRQEFLITEIIRDLGGAAIITKIMVELYKRMTDDQARSEFPDRKEFGAKIYRMTHKNLISASTNGKGWYCLKSHPTAYENVQQETEE